MGKDRLTVEQYMRRRVENYYASPPPLGTDFITAPEISSLFGEMIARWCALQWEKQGCPSSMNLIELGPGSGVLMKDILKTLMHLPLKWHVHLVETSLSLQRQQQERLTQYPCVWHQSFPSIDPSFPTLIIANEFFDALPIQQYILSDHQWEERYVMCTQGKWQFEKINGKIREENPTAVAVMNQICACVGGFLIIDYGYIDGSGDTLQALKRHQPVSIFDPESDLTAHVNFGVLRAVANTHKIDPHLITQRDFLINLGLLQRADSRHQKVVERLIGHDQMGSLFKVLCTA